MADLIYAIVDGSGLIVNRVVGLPGELESGLIAIREPDGETYVIGGFILSGDVYVPPVQEMPRSDAIVEQSYRASMRRQADALAARGETYEAMKLLLKAGGIT